MKTINYNEFSVVELKVGKIIRVEDFPEARNPAYQIWADFGEAVGIKKTSAQVTALYTKEDLMDRQIIGVVNFPEKQIGPFMSEFLLTGFADENGKIVLAQPEREVPLGAKLH